MLLAFATLVDPQRGGANTTVIGHFFHDRPHAPYLANHGIWSCSATLAGVFRLCLGAAHVDQNFLRSVALWGAGFSSPDACSHAGGDRPG